MFVNDPRDFDFLEIGLASPDRIRYWSYGEVEKPETINYRTFKPERKGLFCEKIFGPVKDWECSCGKYRRIRYRGIVCERCGVEVTHSRVRRERMGHLELAAPVTHIWFLKGIPGYLGIILDVTSRQLEEVIYYDSYIVTEVSAALEGKLSKNQLLSTVEYSELKDIHGDKFKAEIGANAIKKLLKDLNMKQLIKQLRENLAISKGQKKLKIIKRLRVIEALEKSGNSPEWMVLDAIPVMPPDLRPMVQLEGGRFATSDLNDLYRRVVNRNNRLKRLMDIGAPEMIIRNEKRMLQEAVDVLISNGKRGRAVAGANGRPLKSLGNIIEGKQGRFRQNLLGKRVDYSARSVIVVGPYLKFNQCGLPKEMALELFKPFVIRKLVEEGLSSNVKSAKRKIEKRQVVVWSILEKVIKGKLVLLNRAPTLHRLGIQAFEPILVEGSAIQIHPLVCSAFNADFDGDQMAVHLPLSIEAQAECKLLIESTNNLLSPSSGKAIATPTQDMVLGLYYLTVDNNSLKETNKIYADVNEVIRAHESRIIQYQTKVFVKINKKVIKTTLGRIIFNEAINEELRRLKLKDYAYINHVVGKKQVSDLAYDLYVLYGNNITSQILNNLKRIGFKYSTLSGLSISIEDLTIPEAKPSLIKNALKEIEKLNDLEKKGIISSIEKKERSSEVWRGTTHDVSLELSSAMGELNNVYIMANSGARGNMDQVRQLAGMRGLMSDSQGRTIEIPIRSNFKEGLTLTEYFISAYGARKGLVDTALRTADSGYLTRRLVDVAQNIMIFEEDCGTSKGVHYTALTSGIKTIVPLSDIVNGRFTLEKVVSPKTGDVLIKKNRLISNADAKLLDEHHVESIYARSIYNCQSEKGVCQKCYGIDLATSKIINIGEAAGIIAAQSIGEPGTQLTMRTFHTGGVDLRKASTITITSPIDGKLIFPKELILIKIKEGGENFWLVKNQIELKVIGKSEEHTIKVPESSRLLVNKKANVLAGEALVEYDPNDAYVLSNGEGSVYYDKEKVSEIKEEGNTTLSANDIGQIYVYNKVDTLDIYLSKTNADKYQPYMVINPDLVSDKTIKSSCLILNIKQDPNATKKSNEYILTVATCNVYPFVKGSLIYVRNGDTIQQDNCIMYSRLLSSSNKTQDIVQGLPKVEELFEARKPKDCAILSEYDGVADIIDNDTYWSVIITTDDETSKEYKLPKSSLISLFSGQIIKKGDKLNHGPINPHDIAKTIGIDATRKYLADQVQEVYCSQGVHINRKHIEVIIRQMTMNVTISDMGDTTLLLNEMIDHRTLKKINKQIKDDKKNIAKGDPVLLGITRASLNTDSFVSASSFQQTAGVLTKAAIEGQKDPMSGLKENVIIGKLIPAGTGCFNSDSLKLDFEQKEEVEIAEDIEIENSELAAITKEKK
ncbi:DNA-directed RNA polymerase subunit beta' [Candidatus Marinamargulisbacteria bacterium SCGC AG-333-B06]|nr:DNA-directed RNA polymerase subunit beta' [Candidatus Marinamargulisbacteria bacterium SCGC AG-333-B06]